MSDFKLVKLLDGITINIDNDGLLHKYNGTAAPTVTDDSAAGYAVGSHWIDVTNDLVYVCVDSTNGAAVWSNLSSGGGGGTGTGVAFVWKFDTTTTQPALAAGDLRYNNATPGSVTALFISETTDNGADLATLLSQLTSNHKLYIQQADDATKFLLVTVTSTVDNGTDWTVNVTVNDSGVLPDNNKDLGVIAFSASAGGGSGDVVGPASATNTAIALYDGTTGKLIKNSVVLTDVSGNITGVNSLAFEQGQLDSASSLAWGGLVHGLIQNQGTVDQTLGVFTKDHATNSTNAASWIFVATGSKPGASSTQDTGGVYITTGNNAGSGNSGSFNLASGTAAAGDSGFVSIYSDTSTSGNTGDAILATGNAALKSGDLYLQVGTAGVTQGTFRFHKVGTTVTVGHVWTATHTDGRGYWAAAAGGGANTTLSNLVNTIAIPNGVHLLPLTDLSVNLGSASKRFGDAHLGNIYFNDTNVNISNVGGYIDLTIKDTDALRLFSATGTAPIPIEFWDSAINFNVRLSAPGTLGASYVLKLPTAQGAADTYLKNDGSGNLSFATVPAGYTDEQAQDAVFNAMVDSSSIDFQYNDAGNSWTAVVLPGGVDHNSLLNYSANNHVPSMTAGSVVYHNGTILSQDNATFFWDSTNKRLGVGVGAATNTTVINGATFGAVTTIGADGVTDLQLLSLHRHSATAGLAPTASFVRSRGASGAETIVSNGDVLATLSASGHNGATGYSIGALIQAVVDGTPGATAMPTKLTFAVSPSGSQSPVVAMTIGPTGLVTLVDGLTLTGNITVSGTVDGVDVSTLSTNYTNHAADATIHFTQGAIAIAASQVTSGTFADARIAASNVTQHITLTGDVTSVGLATSIAAGVIVNNDINASAAIDHSKMAALSLSLPMVTDGSGFATTQSYATLSASILHNSTSGYVANEHINHTSVNINTSANSGLAGGGDISATRSLTIDVNNLSVVTPVLADSLPFYDASGAVTGKNTFTVVNGILTFANLADVTLTGVANGDTLRYDSGAAEWVNSSLLKVSNTIDIVPTALATAPYAMVIDHAATNLILNPNFESNTTSWSAVGTGTINRRDSGTTAPFIGSWSLEIASTSATGGAAHAAITVTELTDYVFSCWVKTASGTANVELFADMSSGDATNYFGGYSITPSVTTEWRRVWLGFTTGAGITSVVPTIRSGNASSQTIYVDAVQLEAKPKPTDLDISPYPSTYLDGNMGQGYAWTGTANGSTSSRTSGVKYLAPTLTNKFGSAFAMRLDGSISNALFDANAIQTGVPIQGPIFAPFIFKGEINTNDLTTGTPAALAMFLNKANGTALRIVSEATTALGFSVACEELTSGTGVAIFAPANLSTMDSSNGKFLDFAGKADGASMYSWSVQNISMGNLGFTFAKRQIMYGGGSQLETTRVLAGQVTVTTGSAVVTKAGGAFLTEFVRGQGIRIADNAGATSFTIYSILSVDSDTQLTMTSNYTGAGGAGLVRDYDGLNAQYSPPMINLEGPYSRHGASGTRAADFMYGIFPSGGNGLLRVMKSATRGANPVPTSDASGNSLVTNRRTDTTARACFLSISETTLVTGYTIPAYELRTGNVLRITFGGVFTANAITTGTILRVKLGGTTILTTNNVQAGFAGSVHFRGVIDIVGITDQSQVCNLQIDGKDSTTTGAPQTYSVIAHSTTATVDMRLDRTLTVTGEMSDAASAYSLSYSTVEVL